MVAGAIIDLGKKFIGTLMKVKTNKKNGEKLRQLIDLVNEVCGDVMPQQSGGSMETSQKVTIAMTNLMDALVDAKNEVDEILDKNNFRQAIFVDAITTKLVGLKEGIKDAMDVSLHATANDTNQDVKENKKTLFDINHQISDLRLEVSRSALTRYRIQFSEKKNSMASSLRASIQ